MTLFRAILLFFAITGGLFGYAWPSEELSHIHFQVERDPLSPSQHFILIYNSSTQKTVRLDNFMLFSDRSLQHRMQGYYLTGVIKPQEIIELRNFRHIPHLKPAYHDIYICDKNFAEQTCIDHD